MVRMTTATAVGLVLSVSGAQAGQSGGALPWQAVDQSVLASHSGGSDYFDASTVVQGNVTDSESTNHDNAIINSGSSMENGAIGTTALSGNHGIATAMQNTGNLVNMNYNMNVNVYLK